MAMDKKIVSKIALSSLAAALVTFSGCGSSSSSSNPTPVAGNCDSTFEVLPSTISSDMTLDASKVYGLDGKVKVTGGAVLTVPAGTKVAGCTPQSFMVVSAGSQLNAVGTQAAPVTFTSQKDVLGQSTSNAAGEWGGLVLLGNATTHYGVAKYEADETEEFGCDGSTVACNDTQSSGHLEYVLVKHTGYEVEKDKELNGLSLGGVGSGTVLKNIAIVGGLDDGIEIWGGKANIDGLYVYNAQDDSVDTDLGYRGEIRNVLVQQVNVDKTNNHDSAGMEFGNDNNTITTDDSNATQPTMVNYTAYIKGGGISLKYDAGLIAENVKFVSDKTADTEQVFYRGEDVYNTHAVQVNGDICFKDTAVALDENLTYSSLNSKDTSTTKNAYTDWAEADRNIVVGASGTVNIDSEICAGATEANIWKGKVGSNDPLENPTVAFETLPNTIDSDMTLDAAKTYAISGKVKVTNGAKLTVPAGTTLAGVTPNSFMVIDAGSQLIAVGTLEKPIVFTSKKDVDGNSADNAAGEWGGLVLAGNAYTHYGVAKYEADETVEFGSADHTNDGQSSGHLEYVVVKHTGYEVEKDKELNGLSLAGVGSGTILKNIAIIGGLDDGLEIWGGTVDIDGLYVYNAQDDSVDTDLGYRGTIQNVLVKQVNVDKTNNHDSAGMEFGNDNNTITTDDSNATQPTMVNYTAYIKGGGISLKYDAGLIAENVKFVSNKAADTEQVFYRGEDVYDTAAVQVNGDICFKDTAVALDETATYSALNSKDTSATKNAYTDWAEAARHITVGAGGAIHLDDENTCNGATEASIWKGKAGSNDALEAE